MSEKSRIKVKVLVLSVFFLMISGLLSGCGPSKDREISLGVEYYSADEVEEEEKSEDLLDENNSNKQKNKQKNNKKTNNKEDFIVVEVDPEGNGIKVYSRKHDLEYQYYVGSDTKITNKYGNDISLGQITPGKIINLDSISKVGKVGKISVSPNTWNYTKIKKFSLNEEKRQITVGKDTYTYDDRLIVFSGNEMIELNKISSKDEIALEGKGKSIYSIVVTTGHGTLKLKNTGLFEGSFLQLDNRAFVNITKDLTMDVQEGKYLLAVANDGWGGSKEIVINRGKTTEVDLDEIKGPGPSYGKILFAPNVINAMIFIDGRQVDYANPISLRYGKHILKVMAAGYTTMNKILYVNSPEGTVAITMETIDQTAKQNNQANLPKNHQEVESQRENRQNSRQDTNTPGSNSINSNNATGSIGQNGNNNKNQNSSSNESMTADQLKEYMQTLSELLRNKGIS
ncbi:hypothetical protein [Lachnobacterium bovis]|uniref:hypothetical protein n=1 Tax=Lachnobacterium bovis TaxID=140626 RepID=UPI0003B609E0|nr:hypothetical protein [Lachnobacterium bovis]